MKQIKIKNRFTNKVIISGKYESIKDCLERNRGVNLEGADLRGVNLKGVNLEGVNLEGADLRGVNLRGADLRGVNLRGVNLEGVNLRGADLRGVNIKKLLKINSVQTILTIIHWGKLSDEMTLEMMRHDAESCGIDKMTDWANGGNCPFENSVRDYQFTEKKEVWKQGKPKLRGIELLTALCKDKNYKWE